jgi:hypothetical protein
MYNKFIMKNMNPLQWIVLIGAAASAIGYLFSKFVKLFGTWFKFIDDWYGTDEKPGITQRLNDGQEHFNKIDTELAIIKAELFNNGGSSLRDSIDRIERAVTDKSK